jgi:vitamin B12 transporter
MKIQNRKSKIHRNLLIPKSKFLLLICHLLICLSFVICNLTFALDVPRFYGEEVVVTASRLPLLISKSPWNATVIGSDEVKNFKTVGDALRVVAGVDLQAYGYLGSLNSIRIRGSNPSRTSILLDGRKINSSLNGEADLGDLLTDDIEKIEIVRGPVSALYGSDAVGGVINIITKAPGIKRTFSALSGSFGTQQYIASSGNAWYSFSFNYLKSDGFRINSDYLAKNFSSKFNFPIGGWSLDVGASYYDAAKGIPNVPTSESDPSSASTPNDRQADRNIYANLNLKNENCDLNVFHNLLNQRLEPYVFGGSTNEVWQSGIGWQQNFDASIGKILYGVEARQERGKSSLAGFDQTINNYALFVQDEAQLNEKLLVSAGIRGDKHSIAGTSVNPRAGITYSLSEDLTFKASYGSAFRAPSLNNLFWFGNPSLKPENARAYEAGIERRTLDGNVSRLSYYLSATRDYIIYDISTNTLNNIGEVAQEGVEYELERRIGANGKGFINYSLQKAIDKVANKYLPYVAENKINTGLTFGESTLLIKYVGERYTDLTNLVKLPPYTVVDLKFSKKVSGFGVDLAVENLFDQQFSEVVGNDPTTFAVAARNYPMPGRRYSLGVKWEL